MEKRKSKLKSLVNPEDDPFCQIVDEDKIEDDLSQGQETNNNDAQSLPLMTPNAMSGGILLIDAIGKEARIEFMTGK